MLKNKFGMTKVLVLVLSVLMLVSLVACNKADGPSTDDMNSAIQSAIDAANAEAAAREAALASSIAAAEAEAAAREAALASSLKAEAEKAAADAAAKAEAEASKEASKLAAELAAAEAAASKAQAEASKAAESAKQASIAASKAASEAAEAAKTTTGGNNPGALVDKSAVLAEYSKLKTEYTYTNRDYYLADDYAALVLLFDKASVDLNNALTVDAATSVLETLKVDAAAIESAKTAANEVQALIAALGDIETEVFTTQAEKIVAAREAYTAMKVAYADFFKYDVKEEADYIVDLKDKDGKVIKTVNETVALAEELGVEVDELENAESKLDVLEGFIAKALFEDMKAIHSKDAKFKFDIDDIKAAGLETTIERAHYKYLVLAVINGGDVAAADMPIDWEWKVDKEGKPLKGQYDYTKPTEWFTVDQLIEIYVMPVLDSKLTAHVTKVLGEFNKAMSQTIEGDPKSLYETMSGTAKPEYKDLDLDEIYDALEAEIEGISFVEDYKGTATLDDAKADINTIAINYYIDALNVYLEAAKLVKIEAEELAAEVAIEGNATTKGYEDQIDELEAKLDNDELTQATIDRLNAQIASYNAKIASTKDNLAAIKANVEAATLLTYEEMLNEELAESKDYKGIWIDISDADNFVADKADDIAKFLNTVLSKTIENNFKAKLSVATDDPSELELLTLIEKTTADLWTLRTFVSPYAEDNATNKFFDELAGDALNYVGDYYFTNTAKFEEIVAIIDAAIAAINAENAAKYEDATVQAQIVIDKKDYAVYFRDAAAKAYAEENELTEAQIKANTQLWISADKGTSDYPINYTYTGAEQAAKAVAELYVKAYQDVDTALVALDNYKFDDVKKNVTEHAGYKAILNSLDAGTLKDAVKAVADEYAAKYAGYKTFANNTGDLKVDTLFTKKDNTFGSDHVTISASAANKANSYDYDKFTEKFSEVVPAFEKAFFPTMGQTGKVAADNPNTFVDETAVLDTTTAKVIELWNAKFDAPVLNLDSFKNKYELIVSDDMFNGLYNLKAATLGEYSDYVYDNELKDYDNDNARTAVIGKSEEAIAYEAELDAIVAGYKAFVDGLNIGSKPKIKDAAGNYVDGYDGNKEIKTYADIATACNAYIHSVKGDATYVAYANNDTKDAKTLYEFANSYIFKAYNAIILKNTYGTTRPRATVTVEKWFEGALTTDTNLTASVATPYAQSDVAITASGYKTTFKDGEVEKVGKAVQSIVVKVKNGDAWDNVQLTDNTFTPALNKEYKVIVTYVDEIVLENGGEYTEKDGVKTYTKGDLSIVNGFGADTTVKVKVNGKDVKVNDVVVGKYYATDITVKVNGVALDDDDIDVDEDGYFTFDVDEDAKTIVITPEYAVKPNISVSCGSGIKYYVVTDEENPVWLSGETYKIQLVLEDADADLEAKNGDAAITIADDNTISVKLTDTAAVKISVAVKAAE